MSNHRYSKWWWQDWRGDAALQRCSFAAKGLWMDMLCLLNDGQPYGHLRSDGINLNAGDLTDLIPKSSKKQIEKLLVELETKRVFSRTEGGTIYSRRMVRDGNLSEKGTEAAEKRWGKRNGPPNGSGNGKATARPYGPPNGEPSTTIHRSESESESDAGATREGVFYLNQKSAEEPEPTVAEIKANRDRQLADFNASPAAPLVKAISGELRHFAIPASRKPQRDVHDQIDEIGPRRQVKAFHLTPEQLVVARSKAAAK